MALPEIRPCWVVEAAYVEGAVDRRVPFRTEHLERAGKLLKEGALLLVGAWDDAVGSLLVFGLETEEAVRAVVETDVYWREGIWTGYTVRRLNRVVA